MIWIVTDNEELSKIIEARLLETCFQVDDCQVFNCQEAFKSLEAIEKIDLLIVSCIRGDCGLIAEAFEAGKIAKDRVIILRERDSKKEVKELKDAIKKGLKPYFIEEINKNWEKLFNLVRYKIC